MDCSRGVTQLDNVKPRGTRVGGVDLQEALRNLVSCLQDRNISLLMRESIREWAIRSLRLGFSPLPS